MKIEFTDEQFDFLKEIVKDYTDYTYEGIVDYTRYANESDDETIKEQYKNMAAEEEEKYNEARKLRGYLDDMEYIAKKY